MPLRILLADDHALLRRGLRLLLAANNGWQVCGEADNGRDAIARARELKPDIVVLDISMPQLNGLEAARQIRKELPDAEILFLTIHDSIEMAHEALRAGARGYVLKSDADRDVLSAIEALQQHKAFFTPRVSEMVRRGYLRPGEVAEAQDGRLNVLTAREREVAQLLAEGKTNKEVADTLHLSVKTVQTHRANIMRKLDLKAFSELVRYAVHTGLVHA